MFAKTKEPPWYWTVCQVVWEVGGFGRLLPDNKMKLLCDEERESEVIPSLFRHSSMEKIYVFCIIPLSLWIFLS